MSVRHVSLLALVLFSTSSVAQPEEVEFAPSAQHGYELLLTKSYLPFDFSRQSFDEIWKIWPEPMRARAEAANPEERRRMAFSRYGLTKRPGDDSGKPLQYVIDDAGNWSMNCFSCHGGKVAGRVIPGLPNSHTALQTLTEETRAIKIMQGIKPWGKEISSVFFPLGGSNGTTNAVMFGVALKAFRDKDLNIVRPEKIPDFVHHDMDAPPWWHFKKKNRLYIDGFAAKGHRALMPFLMVKENGPEKFHEWENDFRHIYAYLESIEAPKYPYPIDESLAGIGRKLFNKTCAECHGTYGDKETYPQRIVPIDEVGTDRVRLDGLSRDHREGYHASWFAHHGKQETEFAPEGYLAPPLDGIWASAPYFHNGSVPTLWHVLHCDKRPVVWQRTEDGYNREKVGLEVQEFDKLPPAARDMKVRRTYFDTKLFGKSAAGHTFPDKLTDEEKRAVLEYLKTL